MVKCVICKTEDSESELDFAVDIAGTEGAKARIVFPSVCKLCMLEIMPELTYKMVRRHNKRAGRTEASCQTKLIRRDKNPEYFTDRGF